jgi:hypothetical protein
MMLCDGYIEAFGKEVASATGVITSSLKNISHLLSEVLFTKRA